MKENFKISKPKKMTLDLSKGEVFNLNKLLRFVEKNTEIEKTKGNIKKYASILNGVSVEEVNSDNLIMFEKHYGDQPTLEVLQKNMEEDVAALSKDESPNHGIFLVKREEITGNSEDNTYLLINYDNTYKPGKHGNTFNRRGFRYKYQVVNINSLLAMGLIYTSIKDTWEKERPKMLASVKPRYDTLKDGAERYRQLAESIDDYFLQLFNTRFITSSTFSKNGRFSINTNLILRPLFSIVYNHIEYAYSQHLNYVQMVEYTRERKSEHATSFTTKKNIPKKVEDEMKVSPFLKHFKYVELDTDTDLSKYKKVYEEFEKNLKVVAKIPKKAELRFRKLGHHKAIGVYFPHVNCIAIDLRDVSAFLHEYAHAIDFSRGEDTFSLQEDFNSIIREYKERYSKYAQDNDYLMRKTMYYTAPTEIFARGFELAYRLKGHNSFLVADKDKMSTAPYLSFKGNEEALIRYFSKFIK